MIVYDLTCGNDHGFEAWFPSSEAYDRQRKARKVLCPACGDSKVSKALMAPSVSGTKKKGDGKLTHASGPAAYMSALRELRQQVETNCDNVGEHFPEEARKMHYGESEKRNIYGEATEAEAETLSDEGIDCQRIPWVQGHDA
ncbi:MAG: DUF1178 family protein [Alphaproteobacteria bacterium]